MAKDHLTSSLDAEALLAHQTFVRALARRLVLDDASADDVAQDAWLIAARRQPLSIDAARAWLARIVRNLVLQRRRADVSRRGRECATARPEALESTERIVERMEAHRVLIEAVLALDAPHREIVLQRFFCNRSLRAIAERDQVPFETVRARLRRALALLRTTLDHRDGGPTWAVLIAPLAHWDRAPSAPVLGTAKTLVGGGIMTTIAKVVAAGFVLAAVSGTLLWMRAREPGATPASRPEQEPRAASNSAQAATAEGPAMRVELPPVEPQSATPMSPTPTGSPTLDPDLTLERALAELEHFTGDAPDAEGLVSLISEIAQSAPAAVGPTKIEDGLEWSEVPIGDGRLKVLFGSGDKDGREVQACRIKLAASVKVPSPFRADRAVIELMSDRRDGEPVLSGIVAYSINSRLVDDLIRRGPMNFGHQLFLDDAGHLREAAWVVSAVRRDDGKPMITHCYGNEQNAHDVPTYLQPGEASRVSELLRARAPKRH